MKTFSITKQLDNTIKMPTEYFNEIIPPPMSVKIELTRRCNNRCSFCVNSTLAVKGDMPREKYSEYIRKIYDAGVRELGVFYFGESFIVPWLPEAIKEAKDVGFKYVFLTTNGSLATPDKVKKCLDAGLNSIKFSLNYADEEQFSEIARVNSKYWRKSLDNLKAVKAIRDEGNYECGIYASYIQYNGAQGDKMQAVINEVKPYLDEVYALPLFDQAGFINREGWEFTGGNPGRLDSMVPPVPCWALFREGHVNYDGTMNACCFGVDDKRFIHGDLNKQTFMEAWNSVALSSLRKAHLEKKIEGTPCENCVKKVVNKGPSL